MFASEISWTTEKIIEIILHSACVCFLNGWNRYFKGFGALHLIEKWKAMQKRFRSLVNMALWMRFKNGSMPVRIRVGVNGARKLSRWEQPVNCIRWLQTHAQAQQMHKWIVGKKRNWRGIFIEIVGQWRWLWRRKRPSRQSKFLYRKV